MTSKHLVLKKTAKYLALLNFFFLNNAAQSKPNLIIVMSDDAVYADIGNPVMSKSLMV